MTTFPCIYCRRSDVPRTREHVLQKAFGAAATLPTQVCADCNNAFSRIDKHFVEGVSFYHTGRNILRLLGIGRVQREDGISVVGRVRRDGLGEFLPQLFQASPTTWTFTASNEHALNQMLEELADPSQFVVSSRLVSPEEGWPLLTIVRSARLKFLVQGTDPAELQRFCERLKRDGFKPQWIGDRVERNEAAPPIHVPTSLRLDLYARAMAKVALNFVCYRLGAEVALRSEFDPVRSFARNGDGNWFDFVAPTLLYHAIEDAGAAFLAPHHHGILLFNAPEQGGSFLFVVVEGRAVGRVCLGACGCPESIWGLLSRFDPTLHTVDDFTLPDDMPRALINPDALGLAEIWPKEWA